MTLMHFDATTAAAAVGQTVGFTWEDSSPFTAIILADGGDGFWGESLFELHGEGAEVEGKYRGYEHDFLVLGPDEWINPAFVGNIDQYFFRSIDITTFSDGTIPGTRYSYSGVWTDSRTDWFSLATVSPHGNMTSLTTGTWRAQAAGAYGSSYYEETISCILEIGRLNGLIETFDFGDVSTGLDQITITGHGFETGDQVIFSTGAGSAPTPLVDQAMYSVRNVDANTISLGIGLGAIDATPSFINLTAQGTATGNTLQRIDAEVEVVLILDSST